MGPNNAIKEVEEDLEAGISDQERSARESMKKRAAFSFKRMMIPVGAKLNYRDDNNVEIEVAEKTK